MARQRKVVISKHASGKHSNGGNSSASQSPERQRPKMFSLWKTAAGTACLSIAVYIGILGYLETRVNTPFVDEKVVVDSGLSVPDRFWGSYRPGVYFGLKTRDPRSPVFGLMWYQPTEQHRGIRHWCDQGDNLPSYGWIRHDGVTFGEQIIQDPPHIITTSFVKTHGGENGGYWTARIDVQAKNKTNAMPISLIWYAALDESLGSAAGDSRLWTEGGNIVGHTPSLQHFKISLSTHSGRVLHKSVAEAQAPGLHLLKEKIYSLMQLVDSKQLGRHVTLVSEDLNEEGKEVNFAAIQLLVEVPFTLDVIYSSGDVASTPSKGHSYTRTLEDKRKAFDDEFEAKFNLKGKGYSTQDVAIARSALSNMVGGVGYFYGAGRVRSSHTREPVPYWRAPLYTGVPSRKKQQLDENTTCETTETSDLSLTESFFPRGFLWDEGFHGLLIGRWSPIIQMDIAAHWFDLINVEGWIPREQILGAEALARVPKEFVVQSNAAANPPMFLVQLAHAVKTRQQAFETLTPQRKILERTFTRLQAWYQWFHNTQKGSEPTSFRWRGRHDDGKELNPKTLTSGLDDYPRASHPSDIDRHVDLRCWMYAAADAMVTIANVLQRDTTKYEATRDQLGDEELLNELHWSHSTQSYADYGLHTDAVKLVKTPAKPPETPVMVRQVSVPPQPKLVTSAFGYVSLFPMLLKVLHPDSPKLTKILEDLDNPELLWSPYGLRSLSKTSPYYMQRNTEHDPPYWRGQVWVNMNYLALTALKYYSTGGGMNSQRAEILHRELRENIVGNIISEYKRTGYLWEQYSSEDGRGSGCKPFTGWTALVVLIMAEEY